ncbi:unnamed protein product [Effrenium voratum]|nr:unnamed protein product [Effrenium voratum]
MSQRHPLLAGLLHQRFWACHLRTACVMAGLRLASLWPVTCQHCLDFITVTFHPFVWPMAVAKAVAMEVVAYNVCWNMACFWASCPMDQTATRQLAWTISLQPQPDGFGHVACTGWFR